jgi:hypothetical protein
MPGHMKHTSETIKSWIGGDAYHGNLKFPILNCLYFQPVGLRIAPASSAEYVCECSVGVETPGTAAVFSLYSLSPEVAIIAVASMRVARGGL